MAELHCVRDMVYPLVMRKLKQNSLGQLTERRTGANIKENLLKDVYNLYADGERSLQDLPKNMFKSESKFNHQEVQADSCLSRALFPSKSEVEDWRNELLVKISELRDEFATSASPSQPSELFSANPVTPQLVISSNTSPDVPSSIQNIPVSTYDSVKPNEQNTEPKKIVIAGDSLLQRINIIKMKVNNIPAVKLTRPSDNLSGSISRCVFFIGKHSSH